MAEKGTVPSVALVLLILISLSLAGGAFYLFNKEKLRSAALEETLEDLRAKERIVETKLEDSRKEAYQLESQLREARRQVEVLGSELEEQKKSRQQAHAQLQQIKEEAQRHRQGRAETEEKLIESQQLVKKLESQLKDSEAQKSELENKIKEIELGRVEKVELGTIVIGQQEDATLPVAVTPADKRMKKITDTVTLEGKVLVINKDYNFAVINLGSKDGININDIYSLYHKNKYIGDIKIEKAHESMSAAHFLSPETKHKLREGDTLTVKSK